MGQEETDWFERDHEVVVIGAGIGGLAVGALLSHLGYRVLVLEKRNYIGGRALTFKKDGYTLNYGYRFVFGGEKSPHKRIVKELQGEERVRFIPADLRRYYRFKEGDEAPWMIPSTVGEVLSNWRMSPLAKLGLGLAHLQLMWSPISRLYDISLGEWLDRRVPHSGTREFLRDLAQDIFFEAEPEKLSMGHYAAVYRQLLRTKPPAAFIVGGWARLFDLLESRIERGGGAVVRKADVQGVDWAGREVETIRVEWEDIEGESHRVNLHPRHVVFAVPPNILRDWVPEEVVQRDRWNIYPTRAVAVDIGVRRVLTEEMAVVQFSDKNTVFTCQTLWDPSLAPKGHQLFQIMRFLPAGKELLKAEEVKQVKKELYENIESLFPGFRDDITFERLLVLPRAAGVQRHVGQSLKELLPPRMEPTDRFYFVGDWVQAKGELSNVACEAAWQVYQMFRGRR